VETLQAIKKIQPETAVIMMTAYTVEDLVSEALENGAYGIMFKPFDIRRMLELITKIEATAASTR
jgi:DNA-binding NtrC family response regulator